MKKTIIAGAAALSMAALPMAGVFALSTTVTDKVQLTVGTGCTMASTDSGNAGANTYNLGAVNGTAGGELDEIKGTDMFISCNTGGWTLSMEATPLAGPADIAFGAYKTDGGSVWSARLEGDNGINLNTAWGDIADITLSGDINGGKITPYYAAFVKAGADEGTYVGQITYTFTAN